MTSKTLKLLAQDAEDIQVMAAVLQDAIAPLSDMAYRAAEKSFVMVVQRFCWDGTAREPEELRATSEDELPVRVFERVSCALDIEGVESVQTQGIDPDDATAILDLLTLTLEGPYLTLIFAGGGKIRLQLQNWRAKLCDFGESWPTTHCPRHLT